MIGKQILNYTIESLLGEGGMGTVYLGRHMKMERKVAIKMLHPDLSRNESLRERFKNEASALAQLQNTHIVTLYDFEESDEGLFLIMEFIEGMELADHINKVSGPIDDKKAIHYFTQILDGFKYAHKKKVVHRDIKPSNILITPDDEIKIMDFGIAKIVDSEKSLTKTGTQIGTVFYMSPEQVKGEKANYLSDIYSLGVTLFQMVTGKCPYDNDTSEFDIYNMIVNDPLPDPASIYPGVSEHLAQVIAKATQKNVEDRFQSCEEFKKALNDTALKTDLKEPAVTEPPKTEVKAPINEPGDHEAPKPSGATIQAPNSPEQPVSAVSTDDQQLASAGNRFLAYLIDAVLITVVGLIPVLGTIVGIVYFLLRDALPFLNGQSIGKKAMKIRAVRADNGAPITNDYRKSALRNVSLMIPIFGLVDAFMVFSDAQKRFGDKWAKTKVVIEQ